MLDLFTIIGNHIIGSLILFVILAIVIFLIIKQNLASYVGKKLLIAIPTIFVVITISFFLMRVAPGGPFTGERQLDPQILENIKKSYGLDKPLIVQYGNYLKSVVLHFDLGPSYKSRDFTVNELLGNGFPVSMLLGISALLIAISFGVTLGSIGALFQNSVFDYSIMSIAIIGIVIPNFVLAPLFSLFFGLKLGWLPVAGYGDGDFRHLLLPVVSLSLPPIAYLARLTRASMIEVLNSNYIRTARAKGLSEFKVIAKHALKGALMPVVTVLGPLVAGITTGSVVIERIFGLPGIGRYFVNGALDRDYTLVLGTVIVYSTLLITMNTIVDIVYGFLDPRVRVGSK